MDFEVWEDNCHNCLNSLNTTLRWAFYSCGHYLCSDCQGTCQSTCRCEQGVYLPGFSLEECEDLQNCVAWMEYARNNDQSQYQSYCGQLQTLIVAFMPVCQGCGNRVAAGTQCWICSGEYWQCPKCQNNIDNGNIQCTNCRNYTNLALVDDDFECEPLHTATADPLPEGESGNVQLWKCEKCGYEYNQLEQAKCQRCEVARPGGVVPKIEKEAGSVGPPRPEDPNSPVWTCRKCSYEYNLKETDVCSGCKSPRVDRPKPVRKEEEKASNPPVARHSLPKPISRDIPEVPAARPSLPIPISHDIPEEQFNAGSDKRQNWKCGKCDYATNPVNATVCKRCLENKEEKQQEQISMSSKVLKKKTWKCDCGNTNTELAEVCSHCFDPRNKAAGEEAKRDYERKKKVAADQSSLDSPSKAAVPPSDTGAPWICPDCNTADRKGPKCSVCGRAKPVIRPPPSEPTSDQEKWICGSCDSESRGNKCLTCSKPRPQPADRAPFKPPPIVSPQADHHNDSRNASKKKEKEQKGTKESESKAKIEPVPKIPVMLRDKIAPVGQWKCEHCGFAANMAKTTKCYRCKKLK